MKLNRKSFIAIGSAAAATSALPGVASAPRPVFTFVGDFWLSLHHTLYRQAGALLAFYSAGSSHLGGVQRLFYDEIASIPEAEQQTWYRALSFYADRYSGRSFVFDNEMARIENQLAGGTLPSSLSRMLNAAAPIYRQNLWPMHDAGNRRWIAQQQPLASDLGDAMADRLSAIYGVSWLNIPYRIIAVPSTDRASAFSNMGENNAYFLIVASSMDRDLSGWKGFETIYHEASHSVVDPSITGIGSHIVSIAAELNRPVPTDLWHALIMYTPAAVLEPLLRRRDVTDFVSTFDGLLTTVYPRYNDAFKAHWQPYIDGKTTRDAALRDVVTAVTLAA